MGTVIRTSGSFQRATVMLAVALDGSKLPPLIIFKGSANGLVHREINSARSGYPTGAIYAIQAKAWVNEAIYLKWIIDVFKPYSNGRPSLLFVDKCSVHFE